MRKRDSEPISIGPMADGRIYTYSPATDIWSDLEGPVHSIPYEYTEGPCRKLVYFHPETRRWLNKDMIQIPTGESDRIDNQFRGRYGLNGEVKLLSLRKGQNPLLQDEPEDNEDTEPYDQIPMGQEEPPITDELSCEFEEELSLQEI